MAASSTRKRIPSGLLFVIALSVGVFVAWQAHELWIAPQDSDGPQTPAGPEALPEQLDIGDLLHRPTSVAGLRRLGPEPGGIAAPPDARRHEAFERRSGDRVEQLATYSVPAGSFDEVVEHYTAAAAESGFKLLGERSTEDARVVVFNRNGAQAVLRLRRQPEKAMILVTLSVTLPPDKAGGSGEEH
ncbi:MAG: hypothetical protein ACP5HU_01960 [Phycisphaerae bacterium]